MNEKYTFELTSQDPQRDLPGRLIIGQRENESIAHVALKLMGFVLFYRERLQIEAKLHTDHIPFEPDLIQFDYQLRPRFWGECGECGVNKLHKLAVKAPEAEIWIIKRTPAAAAHLYAAMAKGELRRNRYGIVGLDTEMFEEICGLMKSRNEMLWVNAEFDPPTMQFDFNGLWFDAPFTVLKF